ncbi:MAG: ROK family protein [Clostridiales bacterium]|jgi:glucokinase|nr:ROK family protein [Clostridiales bacterium]
MIIGIDIGGMSVKGGIVDRNGKILHRASVETKAKADYAEIIADIAHLIDVLLKSAGIGIEKILGIGMGIPGTIDSKRGVIVYSNNINFIDVPIVSELKKYYADTPVYINNDANAAALGEYRFGEAKEYKNLVFMTFGTGVGTGIIIDGKLFEGNGSAGAEGGHTVIRLDGPKCTCGRRGCFEVYASATALVRQTKAAMKKHPESLMTKVVSERGKVSGRTAFLAAKEDDPTAKKVVARYIQYVGEGLVNIANIFRPDVILIGGGMSNEGDAFIAPLQGFMDEHLFGMKNGNPRVAVQKASLTNDAGILGAASLVL